MWNLNLNFDRGIIVIKEKSNFSFVIITHNSQTRKSIHSKSLPCKN